jgi:hypothetical protein
MSSANVDTNKMYMVNQRSWSCNCSFYLTRLLPCRHVIVSRILLNEEKLIPIDTILPRWRKGGGAYVLHTALFHVQSVNVHQTPTQTSRFANPTEKYCHVRKLCLHLADVTAKFGERHCMEVCAEIEKMIDIIAIGSVPQVFDTEPGDGQDQSESDHEDPDEGGVIGDDDGDGGDDDGGRYENLQEKGAQPQADGASHESQPSQISQLEQSQASSFLLCTSSVLDDCLQALEDSSQGVLVQPVVDSPSGGGIVC